MARVLQSWQVLLAALAGWVNRHQQAAIDYLRRESRVLKEQLGGRRPRLTDDQRRRLAVKGKAIGRRALKEVATLAAIDFFTVEVWGLRGLVTFYVLIVIELSSRRVHFAGATSSPNTAWMMQAGRNLTDPLDGFLQGKRFVIMDRDRKYCEAIRAMLESGGVEPFRLPPRSPNLNAHAERFVRSVKEECLDRMVFFEDRSLRRAIRDCAAHYHEERNHQALRNRVIEPDKCVGSHHGPVKCRERLGGMLRYYHRRAA